MKRKGPTPQYNLRLPDETVAKLDWLVKVVSEEVSIGLTRSDLVRQLIHQEHARRKVTK